jgi:hypothetical protein
MRIFCIFTQDSGTCDFDKHCIWCMGSFLERVWRTHCNGGEVGILKG